MSAIINSTEAAAPATTRLYFKDEAPRIGSGWRAVIVTKDKNKVRVKDPRTGEAHSYAPKFWEASGIEQRSAEYAARNSVDAAAKAKGISAAVVADAVSTASGTKKLRQRAVKAAPAEAAAPVTVAAKPEPKQLSKDEQRALANALIASSNVPVQTAPTTVAKGAKVQKGTAAAKFATGKPLNPAPAKPLDVMPLTPSADLEAKRAAAKPTVPSVDAMKDAVRKTADAKAAKSAAKSAAKQPKVRKPSALHAAKLLLINDPTLSADDIVAKIAAQKSGLAITRVTASTVRSDFLHSCRALIEAGYLKDLASEHADLFKA